MSSGVYKLKLEVTEGDPTASAGLPVFANTTLRCLVVRSNMTIEYWPSVEQKMFDFSLCMDQAYTRQRYRLEVAEGQLDMVEFDEETAKLTLNYDRIRGKTPVVIQAKISLIDPEFPNCFTYTISSQIIINMKPILQANRLDLTALPNQFFYHEIRDFASYFL